jgi:hypothetical protein
VPSGRDWQLGSWKRPNGPSFRSMSHLLTWSATFQWYWGGWWHVVGGSYCSWKVADRYQLSRRTITIRLLCCRYSDNFNEKLKFVSALNGSAAARKKEMLYM